jgi:DNA repair protein RecO (recombination protein O)
LTLKNFPLGEADLLVNLCTRDTGNLRVLAKGARRSSSKLVGHLEPLVLVRLSLARGRNLDVVTQAQVVEDFRSLKTDLKAITKGLYIAELVGGFGSESNPNPALYYLAIETLQAIGQAPDSEWPIPFFELHLLKASGLMPELYQCVECRQQLAPGHHRFSPNMGGTFCLNCTPANAYFRPLSLRALKVLRLLDRSRLTEIAPLRMNEVLARELRTILSTTVEYWLDKEVRSGTFLEHLRRSPTPNETSHGSLV